jgi:type 1 glutamine amidotransferase
LITGGFPAGAGAGHDHDYARLHLLQYLDEASIPATVANDFVDVERWLPVSQLLVTYVAGPYPDAQQSAAIQRWLEEGGRWVGLHGTSGGRAERIEGIRNRRTIKLEHHAVLGSYFLTHPPIRKFRVDVGEGPETLLRDVPSSFEVVDEPYFIELQEPASTHLLLTAEYGPDVTSPTIGPIYKSDTSLLADGKTRAIGYTREVGKGGVTYFTLGHNHNRTTNTQRSVDVAVDPQGTPPPIFRGSWENPVFQTLLRNALRWGIGE